MKKSGFTLVELLVVLVLIGVLVAIVMPNYTKTVEVSKAKEAIATLQAIHTAQMIYRAGISPSRSFTTGTPDNPTCTPPFTGSGENFCQLVVNNLLPGKRWDATYYIYEGADDAGGSSYLGRALRRPGSCVSNCSGAVFPCGCTNTVPYTAWGYLIALDGTMTPLGTAPPIP